MIYSAILEPSRWAPLNKETMLHYWISLTPAAMLFGVRWRFAATVCNDAPRIALRVLAQDASEPVQKQDSIVTERPEATEVSAPIAKAKAQPAVLYAAPPKAIDDLTLIEGIGPKLATALNQLGIYKFDQIAGFSEANLEWIAANLRVFKNRPTRDNWIEQARGLK